MMTNDIVQSFDFPCIDGIAMELANQPWENDIRSFYLGTVFHWLPSGKYYTPWANSNVEVCPNCHGRGITNITRAALYHRINRVRFYFKRLPTRFHIFTYNLAKPFSPNDCEDCGGLGSIEAYHDQLWYEHMERELDKHGLLLENGEGDPCDLFVSQYREMGDYND